MSYQQQQEECTQHIASSIALQLDALFPDGYSLDDGPADKANSRRLLAECFQNLVESSSSSSSSHHHDDPSLTIYQQDELERSLPIAVQQWKKQQQQVQNDGKGKIIAGGSATAVKSFSLLDQFNSGGFGLPIMISLEELLETPTVPERLEKLQQIQYLEDALPDWKGIQKMLLSGLEYCCTSENQKNDDDSTTGSHIVVRKGYLKLHRKWFHEGRSSSEYLGVQYELCCNLSQCITELVASSSSSASLLLDKRNDNNNQWMFDLIQNWHDMFLDMMLRDQYSADVAKNIESTFLRCLESSHPEAATTGQDDGTRITPAQILALIDPQAHCFATWIHHISPQYLVGQLLDQRQLLPVLWKRCCARGSQKLSSNLRWHSLSILTFILIKTRVALFPWNLLLVEETNDNPSNIAAAKRQVLDLFLESILSQESGQPEWRRCVCCNAIDTILSGSGSDTSTEQVLFLDKVTATLTKLRDGLGGESWVVRRLTEIVIELERQAIQQDNDNV